MATNRFSSTSKTPARIVNLDHTKHWEKEDVVVGVGNNQTTHYNINFYYVDGQHPTSVTWEYGTDKSARDSAFSSLKTSDSTDRT